MNPTSPLAGRDDELTRRAAAMALADLVAAAPTPVRLMDPEIERAYEKLGVRSRAELTGVLDT